MSLRTRQSRTRRSSSYQTIVKRTFNQRWSPSRNNSLICSPTKWRARDHLLKTSLRIQIYRLEPWLLASNRTYWQRSALTTTTCRLRSRGKSLLQKRTSRRRSSPNQQIWSTTLSKSRKINKHLSRLTRSSRRKKSRSLELPSHRTAPPTVWVVSEWMTLLSSSSILKYRKRQLSLKTAARSISMASPCWRKTRREDLLARITFLTRQVRYLSTDQLARQTRSPSSWGRMLEAGPQTYALQVVVLEVHNSSLSPITSLRRSLTRSATSRSESRIVWKPRSQHWQTKSKPLSTSVKKSCLSMSANWRSLRNGWTT